MSTPRTAARVLPVEVGKGCVLFLTVACFVLAPGLKEAKAQVVQLPTFGTFRIGTTVLVPDGGSASLGGIRSASYGRTSRGVPILGRIPGAGRFFRNSAVGAERSATSSRVYADIIDLEEMDRAVLAEAARRKAARGDSAGTGMMTHTVPYATDREKTVLNTSAQINKRAEFISRNIGRTWID